MTTNTMQVLLCMYYRPSTNDKILRHVEHRHTNKVAQEFIDLQYNGMVSQTVINDSLVEAYRVGWDKYVIKNKVSSKCVVTLARASSRTWSQTHDMLRVVNCIL